jgi:hypothetical protein
MPRPPLPKTLREFQSDFVSEEACQHYLEMYRWPDQGELAVFVRNFTVIGPKTGSLP